MVFYTSDAAIIRHGSISGHDHAVGISKNLFLHPKQKSASQSEGFSTQLSWYASVGNHNAHLLCPGRIFICVRSKVPCHRQSLCRCSSGYVMIMCTRRAALLPITSFMRTLVARRGISSLVVCHFFPSFLTPRLRSIRILRASSSSNLALRRFLGSINRRELSLRFHMRANRVRNSLLRSVCWETNSLQCILGLLTGGEVFGF